MTAIFTLPIVFVLCLVMTQESVADHCQWYDCRKTHENSDIIIDGHFCGDQITMAYGVVCGYYRKRRKRDLQARPSLLESKDEGNAFLKLRKKRSYNIVEECCMEGCSFEEIHEYC